MKLAWPVEIAGTGVRLPDRVVTNADFAARLDTTDEWIVQRSGIRERRFCARDESTLGMALAASRQALARAQMTPAELDLIIVGTITPEHTLPSTACELQHALGCRWVPSFDLVAACSGFVFGLLTAAQYLYTGMARTALVVGAETMTSITDMEDRGSCVLFGDGAGAVVLRRSEDPRRGILAAEMGCDGGGGSLIWIPAGGSREPPTARTVAERLHYVRMKGREVYKFAVTQMRDLVTRTLSDAGVTLADVKMLIPHQSNLRIIEAACEKLAVPLEKVAINIHRYGNTSSASVPIALHEAVAAGRVVPGDLVLIVAFGAGLTWGSALVRV